jgi:hypothetical protein
MADSNELPFPQKSLEDIKEIDKVLEKLGKMLQKANPPRMGPNYV